VAGLYIWRSRKTGVCGAFCFPIQPVIEYCVANLVWFGWDGTHLLFSQTTTRQKLRNIERDPRIALSIVDPTNDYRYLEIRGRVVRIDPDPDKAFIDAMAQKYMGVEQYPWNRPGEERVIVVVEPERTTQMGS
jgi:PPOX class probable F420-dependent enzyme